MAEIEIKRLTKLLRVGFTAAERIQMGNEMANAVREIKQAGEELASVSARYKSDIKKSEAEVAGLAERLNSGWEMKKVDCEEIKDFATGNVFIRRLDTGEHVEERAMTFEERQPKLPLKHKEKEETEVDTSPEIPPQTESPPPDTGGPGALPEDTNVFYIGEKAKEEEKKGGKGGRTKKED